MAWLVYSRKDDMEFVTIVLNEEVGVWAAEERDEGYEVDVIDIGTEHDRALVDFPTDRRLMDENIR